MGAKARLAGVVVIALGMLFLLLSQTMAQRSGDIPYTDATFQISQDSTKVVLQVITSGSALGRISTITLCGDGLIEFEKRERGRILEEYTATANIGSAGVHDLMRVAVSHGLPEWDSSTIMAWMRQKRPSTLKVTDGGQIYVALTLERYQRGVFEKTDHAVSFKANAYDKHAEFYPEIKQFQGIVKIADRLFEEWRIARGPKE